MTNTNFFQKLGNNFTFRGNLDRRAFLIMLLFCELIRIAISDFTFEQHFLMRVHWIYTGVLFCYLYGTAIAGRLRNMNINPRYAYFCVLALWFVRATVLRQMDLPRDFRMEITVMTTFFIFLPLFAKDKNALQFNVVSLLNN